MEPHGKCLWDECLIKRASLVVQIVKNLPAMQGTQVWSLGGEDPLEKEMITHSSILAWRIPWTKDPGRLQSTGSQRVRYDWVTNTAFKRGSRGNLAPSMRWGHSQKKATQKTAFTKTQLCWYPDLGLLAIRTVKNEFLLFINYLVCGILLCYPEWTKTEDIAEELEH